jgi:hypothetical protein
MEEARIELLGAGEDSLLVSQSFIKTDHTTKNILKVEHGKPIPELKILLFPNLSLLGIILA